MTFVRSSVIIASDVVDLGESKSKNMELSPTEACD